MSELVYRDGQRGTTSLATGKWADDAELNQLTYQKDHFWLGRAPTDVHFPMGYIDDRHICQVAGSRSGKGTTSIINNLCLWPGSVVVVDPKGENATVTARRRGKGSEYCHGMGQDVHILDPFGSVENAEEYRSCFNPLDAIDPDDEEAIDEAGRIADAIVVVGGKSGSDPFWDESARSLVRGIILHVLTDSFYEGRRNLITVRQLISRGDWESIEALKESGEEEIPSAYELLFEGMRRNDRYEGVISGAGNSFGSMAINSPKTFESVIQVANRNTEFIDSPGMRKCLESSDFALADLKTNPKGVSLYLSLPQRYMSSHYRWLRMMIALTITEMEKVRGQPASGHPILMVLDEFAGLKRMEVIENAAAQIAGYGVKMWFVLQTLGQLKDIYKENWQTFLANSGLHLFAQVDDEFTKKYVSDALGETELTRRTHSFNQSSGTSSGTSTNPGGDFLQSMFQGTQSGTQSGTSSGWSEAIHKTHLLSPSEVGRAFARVDAENHSSYPGIALALIPGKHPTIIHKSNYFEDAAFIGKYDPHPDHTLPLTLEAQEEARNKAKMIEADADAKRRQGAQMQDQIQRTLKEVKVKYLFHRFAAYVLSFIVAGILGVVLSILFGTGFFVKVLPIIGVFGMHGVIKKFYEDYETFIGKCLETGVAPGQILAVLPANPGLFDKRPDWLLEQPEIPQTPSHTQNTAQITLEPEQYIVSQKTLQNERLLTAVKEYRTMTGCSFPEALKAIKEKADYDA